MHVSYRQKGQCSGGTYAAAGVSTGGLCAGTSSHTDCIAVGFEPPSCRHHYHCAKGILLTLVGLLGDCKDALSGLLVGEAWLWILSHSYALSGKALRFRPYACWRDPVRRRYPSKIPSLTGGWEKIEVRGMLSDYENPGDGLHSLDIGGWRWT
jgi:hypothetical protein